MKKQFKAVPGKGIIASTYIRSNESDAVSKARRAFDDWKRLESSEFPLETDSDNEFSWYNEDGLCTLRLSDIIDYFNENPNDDVDDIDMSAIIIREETDPWGW